MEKADQEMKDWEQTMNVRSPRMKRVDKPVAQSWWSGIRPTNGVIVLVFVGIIMGLFGLVTSRGWFKTKLKTDIQLSGISDLNMNTIGPKTREELQSRLNIDKYLTFQDEMKLTQTATAIEVNRLRNLLVTLMIFFFLIVIGFFYALVVLAKRVTEAESDRARLMLRLDSLNEQLPQSTAPKVSNTEQSVATFGRALESVQQTQGALSERLTRTIQLVVKLFTILGASAPKEETEEQKAAREKVEKESYTDSLNGLKNLQVQQRPAAKSPPPLTEKEEARNL